LDAWLVASSDNSVAASACGDMVRVVTGTGSGPTLAEAGTANAHEPTVAANTATPATASLFR
jgi:hypothetical protein